MSAAAERERRAICHTAAYRAVLAQVRPSKNVYGGWLAFHDGEKLMAAGKTRQQAMTKAAMLVLHIQQPALFKRYDPRVRP